MDGGQNKKNPKNFQSSEGTRPILFSTYNSGGMAALMASIDNLKATIVLMSLARKHRIRYTVKSQRIK